MDFLQLPDRYMGHLGRSGNALHQDKNNQGIQHKLNALDNQLYPLLCANQFYRSAIEAITAQAECSFNEEWQQGLFVIGQWLEEQSHTVLKELDRLRG